MSTKCTIACGDSFHLYEECGDNENVYLEVRNLDVEDYPKQMIVPIKRIIWEAIRPYRSLDLTWANRTDEEIVEYVEKKLPEDQEKLNELQTSSSNSTLSKKAKYGRTFFYEKNKEYFEMIYGKADSTEKELIESGVAYYKGKRSEQLQLLEAIKTVDKTKH